MAFHCSKTPSQPPNTILLILEFVFIFSLLTSSAESLSFEIEHFDPNATNTVYNGDAVAFNGEIQLNRVAQVGRASNGGNVHIWDPATPKPYRL
ncbi:hypothetical protein AAC387_Pa02g3356 [Persea americana]